MKMERLIERIDYSIGELEEKLKDKEQDYKNTGMGLGAVSIMMEIENLRGQISALKETRLYIKYEQE